MLDALSPDLVGADAPVNLSGGAGPATPPPRRSPGSKLGSSGDGAVAPVNLVSVEIPYTRLGTGLRMQSVTIRLQLRRHSRQTARRARNLRHRVLGRDDELKPAETKPFSALVRRLGDRAWMWDQTELWGELGSPEGSCMLKVSWAFRGWRRSQLVPKKRRMT